VAAHLEPEILIADEVLAVGDMAFQQKCLGRMNDAARDGRTVVLVSHNATAVADLCDHVLYLERGAVRAYGPPKEVLEAYNRDLAANPTLTAPAFATQEPATATR
jgi:lipopolysaccharide transport system ATP-binding protein